MRARCGTIPCLPFSREKAPLAAVLPIIRSAAVAARILFASLAAFRYGSCAGRAPKASRHSLLAFFSVGAFESHGNPDAACGRFRGAKRTAGEAAAGAAAVVSQNTPSGAECIGAPPLPASTGRSTLPL